MEKMMRQYSFTTWLKSLAVVFSIVIAFASCANDDITQKVNTSTGDDKNLTVFSTGDPTTRTTMKDDGTFYWEAGDKIYVKDDNGTWNVSSNAPTGKTASFKFKVPGIYTAHSSYEVYYPGKNGNNDQVTISAVQTQEKPNTTEHFGESGDCGMATATRIGTNHQFSFTLDHKAAYLVFQPYTSNTILHDCYLTKIEVTSDNDITDTYTLDPTADTGAGALTGTGSGKQIVLTTKGSGSYANGFPLTNNSASLTTNGAYMVIKPGMHTLKIRYWVKDIVTNVEGTITKILASHNFAKNEYVKMEADLKVRNYDGKHYYMYDARKPYWEGYEWDNPNPALRFQPVLNTSTVYNYPQNNADPRWWNESLIDGSSTEPATTLFKSLPNVNEMAWYVKNGDPHQELDELWTTMGHLHKGGAYILKRQYITGFSKTISPDGSDMRGTAKIMAGTYNYTPIPIGDNKKYFFLPFLGVYIGNQFVELGEGGSGRYPASSIYQNGGPWFGHPVLYMSPYSISVGFPDGADAGEYVLPSLFE